jgi:protein TonB
VSRAASLAAGEQRLWGSAALAAIAVHAAVAAVALLAVIPADPPVPEPVVLVELPPEAAPAVQSMAEPVEQQQSEPLTPQVPTPPIEVPPVRAPLPQDPVVLPPPTPPQPQRQVESRPAPAPVSSPVAAAPAVRTVVAAAAPSTGAGSDPRAKKQEADYFSMLSAHLNKRKSYPAEARKARQQGVVTVRFTVDRNGNVSGAGIKASSGHAVLDDATLTLLQRVAPLPKFPASMQKDSVTLSLPIAYSLRTD